MLTEVRFSELRAEGRTLRGIAMPYDTVSPGHREKFQPGAFIGNLGDVALDVQHDRRRIVARTGGGGLELRDTPAALYMVAHLPETREAADTLTLVRNRVLRGLSVEFIALKQRYESGIRVISKAALPRLSVVDAGSYPGTDVQVRYAERRARIGRLRGRVPYGGQLSCGCHRGRCSKVNFRKGAFKQAMEDEGREILLVRGEYRDGLSSRKRGTLTLEDTNDGLIVDAGVPNTAAGRDLLEQSTSTRLLMKPFFDQDRSEYAESGDVATYSNLWLRAFIIGASDDDGGWPDVEILDDDVAPPPAARRRRIWL